MDPDPDLDPGVATPTPPSPYFLAALERLEREWPQALLGPALDLACGGGRHALLLARRGIPTDALDRDAGRIARLQEVARAESLPLRATSADLEAPGFCIPGSYSLVVVVNYLHRALFPLIARALLPGGALYYETFTVRQPRFGRPTNPDYLLEAGELRRAFAGLTVLEAEEGVVQEGPGPSSQADKARLLAVQR